MSVYFLLSFVLVLALMPSVGRMALRARLVDAPGGRKIHRGAVPLIGGLMIFPTFMAVATLSGIDLLVYWPLFVAVILLLVTGALDDRFTISAKLKFLMQFVAAFLIVLPGGAVVTDLGDLFGGGAVELGAFAIPFSVFCAVLLINSVNLMDGLDGLAGGKSFVMFGWLLLACYLVGQMGSFTAIGILMSALAGFLVYNVRTPFRKRATIFLGDAGSMSFGLVLAWFVIHLSQGEAAVIAPISVAWIVALPVIDACGQFCRRILEGRSPFSADRGHFHYYLVDSGLPIERSVPLIWLIGVLFGAIGYGGLMLGVPVSALFGGWLVLWAGHMVISLRPAGFQRWLKARFSK